MIFKFVIESGTGKTTEDGDVVGEMQFDDLEVEIDGGDELGRVGVMGGGKVEEGLGGGGVVGEELAEGTVGLAHSPYVHTPIDTQSSMMVTT